MKISIKIEISGKSRIEKLEQELQALIQRREEERRAFSYMMKENGISCETCAQTGCSYCGFKNQIPCEYYHREVINTENEAV